MPNNNNNNNNNKNNNNNNNNNNSNKNIITIIICARNTIYLHPKNGVNTMSTKMLQNEEVKILWDFKIQTGKQMAHNIPNITVVEKKQVWLIDVAIPGDSRIEQKEVEKITKYQDLKVEVERLWEKKATVVPVVVGDLGAITRDLVKRERPLFHTGCKSALFYTSYESALFTLAMRVQFFTPILKMQFFTLAVKKHFFISCHNIY